MSGIGGVWLESPIRGVWVAWPALPELAQVRGIRFERTHWWLSRPRAVASYREDRCGASAHLYVLEDGTWIVDHIDTARPHVKCGLASIPRHVVRDVMPRRPAGALGSALGVAAWIVRSW